MAHRISHGNQFTLQYTSQYIYHFFLKLTFCRLILVKETINLNRVDAGPWDKPPHSLQWVGLTSLFSIFRITTSFPSQRQTPPWEILVAPPLLIFQYKNENNHLTLCKLSQHDAKLKEVLTKCKSIQLCNSRFLMWMIWLY